MKTKDLRDAPVPPHSCLDHVDADGYCTACGERPLREPVTEVLGLMGFSGFRPGELDILGGWTSHRARTRFDLRKPGRGR